MADLQTRIDRKYLVPLPVFERLIALVEIDSPLLDIDGLRVFDYESIYFDTEDLLAYRQHAHGAPEVQGAHARLPRLWGVRAGGEDGRGSRPDGQGAPALLHGAAACAHARRPGFCDGSHPGPSGGIRLGRGHHHCVRALDPGRPRERQPDDVRRRHVLR